MLDAYQLCPCGSGKKVKFCCSKDIISELDKITTAIRSDQRVSAMEQINRLIDAKGDRDCLLVVKIALLIQLRRVDAARELVDGMLEANPENPLVLANAAGIALHDKDVDQAVVLLQNALDAAQESIPNALVRSFKSVGVALLMAGRFNAGRVHLGLYASWQEEQDEEVVSLLMHAYSAAQIPLLLREDHVISEPGEEAEWSSEWPQINELVRQMRYRSAIERLRELEARIPKDPIIRRNIAVLESRLGDNPAIADAWRAYAMTEGVELEQAIEAEAIAQLLDDDQDRDFLELQKITYRTEEVGDVTEKMLADPHFDLARSERPGGQDDGPPPKAIFHLLDRPVASEGTELTLETISEITADIYIYGKQTDVDARVVIQAVADEKLEAQIAKVKALLGELLGEQLGEIEVLDRFTRQSALLGWQWRMPSHATAEDQERLALEKHRQVLHEVWPSLSLDVLDGKTPKEAASDPNHEIALSAAILLLEQSGDERLLEQLDINDLRTELGIRTRDVIDPAGIDLDALSLSQFCKLDHAKLADDVIFQALERASVHGLTRAAATLLSEVLERDSISDDEYDGVALRVQLSRMTPDNDRALTLMHEAQSLMSERGESIVGLLINEVDLRLSRALVDGLQELVQRIDRDHIREPGVANALANVLQRYGLFDPNAGGAMGGPGGAPGTPPMAGGPAPGGQGAAVQSEIWTPDADPPAAQNEGIPAPPSDEGPSKLWLPGMD